MAGRHVRAGQGVLGLRRLNNLPTLQNHLPRVWIHARLLRPVATAGRPSMRIAVLSDSHDHLQPLASALEQMGTAEAVIHCGDLVAPFVVKRMAAALQDVPVHIVWGNNDGDHQLVGRIAQQHPNLHLHGLVARLELGGWRVAVVHYPDLGRDMALSGQYDLVCYGHDHTAHQERIGDCWLLNPGELMGMNGRSSFAWVDTDKDEIAFVDLM